MTNAQMTNRTWLRYHLSVQSKPAASQNRASLPTRPITSSYDAELGTTSFGVAEAARLQESWESGVPRAAKQPSPPAAPRADHTPAAHCGSCYSPATLPQRAWRSWTSCRGTSPRWTPPPSQAGTVYRWTRKPAFPAAMVDPKLAPGLTQLPTARNVSITTSPSPVVHLCGRKTYCAARGDDLQKLHTVYTALALTAAQRRTAGQPSIRRAPPGPQCTLARLPDPGVMPPSSCLSPTYCTATA